MKKENLVIVSNEKVHFDNKSYFCDNIDMKSIPEGLSKNFEIELFVRKSKFSKSPNTLRIDLRSSNMISKIVLILRGKLQI